VTIGGGNQVRVTIVGDASQLKKEYGTVVKASTSMVDTIKRHAGAIKAALAVAAARAVKDFVFDSIQAFSDLEQAIGGTDAVFGKSADQIQEWAADADQAVGLSKEAFNRLATLIGAQLQNLGFDLDESTEKTGSLIDVAADLAATYGGPVTKAVEAISSLLQGQSRPIRAYAINILDADKRSRALALGLGDANGELDRQALTVATLDLIMEQSGRARGQFARESETVEGKTIRLNAALENQKALLGEAIAPIYLQMMEVASNLIPIIGTLATAFAALTGSLDLNAEALRVWEEKHGRAAETGQEIVDAINAEIAARYQWSDAVGGGMAENEKFIETLKKSITTGGHSEETLREMQAALADLSWWGPVARQELEDLNAEIEQQSWEARMARAELHWLSEGYSETGESTEEFTDVTEDATEAIVDISRAQRDAIDAAADYRDELGELTGQSDRTFSEMAGDVESFLTGFRELPEEADISMAEFEANFRARAEVMESFWTNLGILADQGLDALVDEMIRGGPEMAGVVEEYVAHPIKAGIQNAYIEGTETGLLDAQARMEGWEPPNFTFGFNPRLESGPGPSSLFVDPDATTPTSSGLRFRSSPTDVAYRPHTGGVVHAPRGQEVLARVLGGETIGNPNYPGGGNGGGVTINISALDSQSAAAAVEDVLVDLNRRGVISSDVFASGNTV
jgi:hypothetical protein